MVYLNDIGSTMHVSLRGSTDIEDKPLTVEGSCVRSNDWGISALDNAIINADSMWLNLLSSSPATTENQSYWMLVFIDTNSFAGAAWNTTSSPIQFLCTRSYFERTHRYHGTTISIYNTLMNYLSSLLRVTSL